MELSQSLLQLENTISEMATQLEAYSKKADASTSYIDRQNNTIKELVIVYNSFSQIQIKPHWLQLEAEINRLESLDPHLSGHHVMLRTKPTGHHFSFIQFNSFNND